MKKIIKLRDNLRASWLGILNFERLDCTQPELVCKFYNCEINNVAIRKSVITELVLPSFLDMNDISKSSYKKVLLEVLTFTNEELRGVFDAAGLVFKQPIQDPYAFLVDLWNIVFPDETVIEPPRTPHW